MITLSGGRLNLAAVVSQPLALVQASPELVIAYDDYADTINLTLSSIPGVSHTVERSFNLINWTPIYTGTTDSFGAIYFYDSQSDGYQPFYQAVPHWQINWFSADVEKGPQA